MKRDPNLKDDQAFNAECWKSAAIQKKYGTQVVLAKIMALTYLTHTKCTNVNERNIRYIKDPIGRGSCEKQFVWDIVTWLRFGPSDVSALVAKLADESGNVTLHATTKLQQAKCFWRSKWGNRHRRKVRRRKDALTAEQKKERVKARRDKFLFGKKTTKGSCVAQSAPVIAPHDSSHQ